jgi:predicted permease
MMYPETTPRWRRYVRFWRHDVQADIDEELQFHFETRIEDLVSLGMFAAEARAKAAEEFGDLSDVRQDLRAIGDRVARRRRSKEWISSVRQDVSFAVRSLRRTPGIAVAILSTLALGLGVNAAMFTLLDTIFLRPPAAVAKPMELRRVWWEARSNAGTHFWPGFSYPQYSAAVTAVAGLARTAIYRQPNATRVGGGETARTARVSHASASYFPLLGVRAYIGRTYTEREDDLDAPAHVAVVSYDFWRSQLGGDSSIVGKPIKVSGDAFTIVGVTAEPFTGVDLDATDLWIPLAFVSRNRMRAGVQWWRNNNVNGFSMLVRPGTATGDRELEQRLTAALRRPETRYTTDDPPTVVRFGSIVAANGPGEGDQEIQIAVRLGGVAIIVLLITCANVVNLLLARAVRRRREIAVRLALGISRARLYRLLLAESVVLAALAAIISLMVAYWGGAFLRSLLLPDVHWTRSPLDWRVALFAIAASLGAGVVAGFVPAFQASRPQLTHALKTNAGDGRVQRSRLRDSLVVVQAALSVVLLVGAALFVRSLANVRALNLGFDAKRLTFAAVSFEGRERIHDSSWARGVSQFAGRVAQVPGVEAVALTSMTPMSGFSTIDYFTQTDSAGSRKSWMPTVTGVSREYFLTAGLHFVRGAGFPSVSEPSMSPVVVVNEEMARVLWPNADAVGQCMRFDTRDAPCYRVSGIVGNSRRGSLIERPTPQYYLPLDQIPPGAKDILGPYWVVIRVEPARAAGVSAELRAIIRQEFPNGIPRITRLSDYLEPQYRPWQLGAVLFTTFGILALVVAGIGIYSTVSYAVTQRTQEFGVRIALGARLGDVLLLVLGKGVGTVAVGVACGILLAVAGGRLIASLLYGIAPSDPITLIAVAAMLLTIAALAALAPAWRASRVDPVIALRAD